MIDFLKHRADLWLMIALAALLQTTALTGIPFLSYFNFPLNMLSTYFHEMSHGIGALLTGGHFYHIQLAFGQGGLANADGGTLFGSAPTIFAGYLGPTLWGWLLYMGFTRWLRDKFDLVPFICMGIAGFSILFWARDIRTIGIIVMVAAVFQSIARMDSDRQMYWAIKFLAVYLIIEGGLAPAVAYYRPEFFLPSCMQIWDGRALDDITNHNELFWVHCWMAAAAAAFLHLLYMEWRHWELDSFDWSSRPNDL